MSEEPEHHSTRSFKAAFDRLTGWSLALFEYLLAVGTIAVLILNIQTGISTLAAVIAATFISIPLLLVIHFWTEWEKRRKTGSDDT
ncbi:hypothetical protein FPY71_07345 [Aureimonas fodinaquatilis]|uniref:Uncharacterized protein n=1 Tax=Aureimonas fodinaquatilis TaxID=2565783 RepID=A0A5B0DWY7_9HYPH|nr:hypothetical protein [Aureimonas fodinaquatilis]KAA0970331.1 hypothetical protein FPY71_07345 [Aureimonas fodinaquatilis]